MFENNTIFSAVLVLPNSRSDANLDGLNRYVVYTNLVDPQKQDRMKQRLAEWAVQPKR